MLYGYVSIPLVLWSCNVYGGDINGRKKYAIGNEVHILVI